MKQKQSAPYWSPVTLCTTLSNRRQDASSYEGEEGVRGRMEEKLQLLEVVDKLQVLQHLCEALQGRGEKVRWTCHRVCFWLFLHCFILINQVKVNI